MLRRVFHCDEILTTYFQGSVVEFGSNGLIEIGDNRTVRGDVAAVS